MEEELATDDDDHDLDGLVKALGPEATLTGLACAMPAASAATAIFIMADMLVQVDDRELECTKMAGFSSWRKECVITGRRYK